MQLYVFFCSKNFNHGDPKLGGSFIFVFNPKMEGMIQFGEHIFQMGRNQQLDNC